MSVYDEIKAEREYQDKRWGVGSDDTLNTPWMWSSYIGKYATNWMAGTFQPLEGRVVDGFRKSMIKTAAIAVAAVESIDRQRAGGGKTFFE
jgi:hypothetical protein